MPRREYKPPVIRLVGGPLDGTDYTLNNSGLGIPDSIGLPNAEKTKLHWYVVRRDQKHADFFQTVDQQFRP